MQTTQETYLQFANEYGRFNPIKIDDLHTTKMARALYLSYIFFTQPFDGLSHLCSGIGEI
jgi:hypothetical protein